MKLKSRPADFQVEEITEFRCDDGPFAVYLLTKESLGTPSRATTSLSETIRSACSAGRFRSTIRNRLATISCGVNGREACPWYTSDRCVCSRFRRGPR